MLSPCSWNDVPGRRKSASNRGHLPAPKNHARLHWNLLEGHQQLSAEKAFLSDGAFKLGLHTAELFVYNGIRYGLRKIVGV